MGPSEPFLDRPRVEWSSWCLLGLLSSGSIQSIGGLLALLSSCSALGLLSMSGELLSCVIHGHLRSSSVALTHRRSVLQGILLGHSTILLSCLFEVQTRVISQPDLMHLSLVSELYWMLWSYILGSCL